MDNKWILMNFSHIYEEENFWKEDTWADRFCLLDCTDIEGTNCYVSPEGEEEIRKRIQNLPVRGIHFIDSGNYHYVTRLWLEKIQEPFCLLVLDHHTDMQSCAFEGLTSCGDWVKQAFHDHPCLEEVVLLGPPKEALEAVEEPYRQRLRTEVPKGKKIYISVDKDVFTAKDAVTNWDQGDWPLEEGISLLRTAMRENTVLGMDVCGEPQWRAQEGISPEERKINDRCNRRLCQLWLEEGGIS